jgi:hypothetical protein
MAKQNSHPKRTSDIMRMIGLWATFWWGISGLFVVLLVWSAQYTYIEYAPSGNHVAIWIESIKSTYVKDPTMQLLSALIVSVWVLGGIVWLHELKRLRITYTAAFKDLFLTIR